MATSGNEFSVDEPRGEWSDQDEFEIVSFYDEVSCHVD